MEKSDVLIISCAWCKYGTGVTTGYNNVYATILFVSQSLTTLRDVRAFEFNFLGSLQKLETLEIGDCESWDSEVSWNDEQWAI